jgi:hypothetical protein
VAQIEEIEQVSVSVQIPATGGLGEGADGRMLINGGIVAADIGLLAPVELQINFDERGGSLLDLRADTQVFIRRQLMVPAVGP